MRTFIHKPWVAKTGRYIAAYALFAIFAILGILILFRVRSNIFDLCVLFSVNSSVTYLMYSWGTYILFIPYVFFIALLEPYLNKAARTGQVFARSKESVYHRSEHRVDYAAHFPPDHAASPPACWLKKGKLSRTPGLGFFRKK